MHEPARLRVGQRKTVRARIEVDLREARLDVLTHLHRALVQERFAVVEEINSHERRAHFIDDAAEQVEIEHACLPRACDAGLGRAARLIARDVARGRAFDVHARGQRARVDRAHDRSLVSLQRQLQRAIAAEPRAACIQIGAQLRDRGAVPHLADRRGPHVAEDAVRVRIGAAADDAAVAEHDQRRPGPRALETCGQEVEGHYFLVNFFMYDSSLSFSYFTVLRNKLSAR